MSRVLRIARSACRAGLASALPLALAACTRAGPTPEPSATLLAAPWTAVPVTAVPTAATSVTSVTTATLTSGEVVDTTDATATAAIAALATQLSATVAALAAPASSSAAAPSQPNTPVPIAGCAVPRQPLAVGVEPGADAPEPVKAWWAAEASATRSFDGEVVASDGGGTSSRVRALRDGATFEVTITSDVPLPLSPGRRVHVRWHDLVRPTTFSGDTGYALSVADDDGLVALVVARGLHLPAGEPLLEGDRGGWTIEQLRSPCIVPEHDCGFALYAAPVQFSRGPASVTVGPGEDGVLTLPDGGPAYGIRVATSHFVVDEGSPCSDWASWLLSYAVVRK